MRLSDYVVDKLSGSGVTHCYLVTGRGSLYLSDAVAKSDLIRAIPLHHEQSAAYAAVAEASYSGNMSFCLVSTGCAATNAISAILTAWQDSLPMIVISGQNHLSETTRHTGIALRTYGQQETDIISLVEPITKFSHMLEDAADIGWILDKAIYLANDGRKGPVWIDIPIDLQSAQINTSELKSQVFHPDTVLPTNQDLMELTHLLHNAKRPIILAGGGVRSSNGIEAVSEFSKSLDIPIVYTSSAVDTFDGTDTLVIGSVGAMGCSRAGNMALQNSDCILVLGSKLSSSTTGSELNSFAREAKIIVVDIDSNEHSKEGAHIDLLIRADVNETVAILNQMELARKSKSWSDSCFNWKNNLKTFVPEVEPSSPVDLYSLAYTLNEVLPEDAILVTDSGLCELIIPTNTRFTATQRCLHPSAQGAMGYALPAAIGAAIASGREVLVIVGDGSIMMNLQELQSIYHLKLPIKIIVVNNNVYAIIRKRQKELFRNRTVGTDETNGVSCPNFQQVANAFGLKYMKIESNFELTTGLRSLLALEGPSLCEMIGLTDQDYVRISGAVLQNGRFAWRPLEDQAPFLARDEIQQTMLIDTWNLI